LTGGQAVCEEVKPMHIVLERILVPTDFSDGSQSAMAYGVALVEEFGASLHLLHVVDEISGVDPVDLPLSSRQEVERKVGATAWTEFRNLLSPDEQSRVRAVLALEWGTPSVEILRYAKTHAIDLIAMATRGRGGVQHLLIGSVAESVVRSAPCPVLTVRRSARQFVRPSMADETAAEHSK
jgi:universal stress protein A